MAKEKNELYGIWTPIMTPLNDSEGVDEAAMRKLVRHLAAGGVHGLLIGGSSSEAPLLTLKEWVRMMEIGYDEAKGKMAIMGGVMESSTPRTIEKMRILEQIGYEYFAVTPGYYITQTIADEFLRHFGRCYEARGKMEMVAYNMPLCVNSCIPVDTLCEMARRGWYRYCKDSSGSFSYFKEAVYKGREAGLKMFTGTDSLIVESLQVGGCGSITIASNYEPKTFAQAYDAFLRDDKKKLDRLNQRILFLSNQLIKTGPCWLSGTKYALSTLGIGSDRVVSPLEPATRKQKELINELKTKKSKKRS